MSIRPNPAFAGRVRRNLSDELSGQGATPEAVQDLVLITSELLSNSLRHGRPLPTGDVQVDWSVRDGVATVSVTDGGTASCPGGSTPVVRQAAPTDLNGRGLSIVDALADRWGIDATPGSMTVWAVRHI